MVKDFTEKKKILDYCGECFCIIIPVYYEYDIEPAWRVVFKGNKKECENIFNNYPDYMTATTEENRKHKRNIIQEYIFLQDHNKKEADRLKAKYIFL